MISAFQDREYLYMTMEYLRGGDLRYHLCFYEFFSEEQASKSIFIQNLWQGALFSAFSISTPKESSTETSNLRTWSLKKTDIWGLLTLGLHARGKKATLNKLVELPDIWLLRSFVGWIILSKQIFLLWGSSSMRWWWAQYFCFHLASLHGRHKKIN